MNEQWIKQMQQKMADYKQPAPEVSWDAIDNAMAVSRPHYVIPFKYWIRGIAAAVVLLLITGISIRFLNRPEETPVQQQTAPVNDEHITTVKDNQLQPQLTDSPTQEPQPTYLAETTTYHSKTPETDNTTATIEPTDITYYKEEPSESDNTADVAPAQNSEQEHNATQEPAEPLLINPDVYLPTKNRHKTNRLMAQAYMSNAMSGSRQTEYNRVTEYNEIILKPNGTVSSTPNGTISTSNTDYPIYYDTIINVYNIQTNQNIRHHQPIKFGLSLRYQFDDRWSLESGLTYTLLASDITTVENGIINYSNQKLHYIGVPLNIGYQLWTDHNLGIYVTAGGTIDKLLNDKGWQYSVNGSAGAEYILNNRFSLYFEPGITYYFPNNSHQSTIYQDNPLNLNLILGLRFYFK